MKTSKLIFMRRSRTTVKKRRRRPKKCYREMTILTEGTNNLKQHAIWNGKSFDSK